MKCTERSAKLLLLAVISARATSFCFSKLCLLRMGMLSLLGIRFTLAFVLLVLVFYQKLRQTLIPADAAKGILFGGLYFLVMVCEYTGLRTTATATASFIENTAIVLVPFLNLPFTRKLPTRNNILCILLAVTGIGLLTLTKEGWRISGGEAALFGAAFCYASAIVVTNRLSKTGHPLNMGIFQVGTIGLLGLCSAGATGTLTVPDAPEIWLYILMLAVVCTGFGYTLQPVAQSKLSAETAGLFCAVNPLVASVIGCVVLKELPTPLQLCGEGLILLVLVVSCLGKEG